MAIRGIGFEALNKVVVTNPRDVGIVRQIITQFRLFNPDLPDGPPTCYIIAPKSAEVPYNNLQDDMFTLLNGDLTHRCIAVHNYIADFVDQQEDNPDQQHEDEDLENNPLISNIPSKLILQHFAFILCLLLQYYYYHQNNIYPLFNFTSSEAI